MGRTRSRRDLIEDSCKLTIGQLQNGGFLKEGQVKGTMTFTRGGASLTIEIESVIDYSRSAFFFIYSYEVNSIRITDWFRLEKVALRYGDRFFFRCRQSGKMVTAMYFVNGRFGSRYVHNLGYRVCREHRQWYENHQRFQRYSAKWEHLVSDMPIHVRRSFLRSGQEKAYGEKAEKYGKLMLKDFDRRFSKYEDQIRRNTLFRKSLPA